MKKMKIYIMTYKRCDVLNDTLEKLFKSDFSKIDNTEVNIVNNHTEFYLRPKFKNKVNVLHNVLRPDWSNGNISENYNQAFINGIINLNKPDTEILVTLQNDAVVHPNWCKNLDILFNKKGYDFVTGLCGDTVTAYKVSAVRKIGMWDENLPAQYKETDYFLRALIYNKSKSSINDIVHGILLNHEPNYPIESFDDRNFVTISEQGKSIIKRKPDDDEQKKIWEKSRGGMYKNTAWNYFYRKWEGTWDNGNPIHTREKMGWIKNWSKEIIENPPDMKKSKIKNVIRYIYFEKDLDLQNLNYMNYNRPNGN
tara:strand:+ start:9521 stop:10450 length:930 start_codon:yes stop_codon:yes gene_type:complete